MRHVLPLRSPLTRVFPFGAGAGPSYRHYSDDGPISRLRRPRVPNSLHPRPRIRDIVSGQWSLRHVQEGVKRLLRLHRNIIRTKSRLKFPRIYSGRNYRIDDRMKMHSHIKFITTPTADTPGTGLVLHFDDKRYFFGQVHEGLQRASLQHGSKLLKVREVFLTGRTELQTTGGLLGLILTLADSAKASLESQKESQRLSRDSAVRRATEEEDRWLRTAKPGKQRKSRPIIRMPESFELTQEPLGIHGGRNITHTLATARSFVFRHGMPMDVDEFTEGTERTGPELDWRPTWEDDHIKVWTIPIKPAKREDADVMVPVEREPGGLISRKRSLGNYMNGQVLGKMVDLGNSHAGVFNSPEDQAQKIREHVVHEMFRSSWRFDNLVETPLADVRLPAKLFVHDPETKNLKAYDGPLPDGTSPMPDINVLVRKPWPGALITHLPPTTPSSTALSYIVRNHKQRGKFIVKKAKDLGVPAGPMFNSLTKGDSVTLEDGRIVTPDQVLEPGKEGGGVAIIDLPSRDYISTLLRRPEWYEEKVMTGVNAFIWILGPGLAHDELLVAFMNEFREFKHILSSPEQCANQLMMTSAACASVRHHLMDPERYSLLQHHNIDASDPATTNEDSRILTAKPGLKLQLEPSVELQVNEVNHPVNLVQALDEVPAAVYDLAKQAKANIKADLAQFPLEGQELPSPDAEIIFLGTGSAMPSQHRNVSGTLLRVPGYGSYLFDAGENTLGQLKRIYSPEELAEVFRDLKMIWISHLHADHHLGTAAVVKAWYKEVHGRDLVKRPGPSLDDQLFKPDKVLRDGRRLFIVSNSHMLRWLYEYSSVEDYGYDQLVPLEAKAVTNAMAHPEETRLDWNGIDVGFKTTPDLYIKTAMYHALGLQNLAACYVSHCHGAMAVAITFSNGFKFSYSGDCRPSRNFAAIGKGSTVLVHEATFDDELQGDAVAKRHSTISEAIGVGVEMDARRVILTHFSQRYSKIPTMTDVQGMIVKLEEAEVGEDGNEMEPIREPGIPIEAEPLSAEKTETHQTIGQATQQSLNQESQRVKLTIPANLSRDKDMKIIVAFDYMRVKVEDIASLERFTPALRELYKDDEVTPIEDRRRSSLANGDHSGTSHRDVSQRDKGEKRKRGDKSGSKRQAATADEDAELKSKNQRIADRRAGIGSREHGSIIRHGGKPNLKRRELVNRKSNREGDWVGLVEGDAPSAMGKICMSYRQLEKQGKNTAQGFEALAEEDFAAAVPNQRKSLRQMVEEYYKTTQEINALKAQMRDGTYGADLAAWATRQLFENSLEGISRRIEKLDREVYASEDLRTPRINNKTERVGVVSPVRG